MLKLLHTADWQIGKQYGQFEPEEAALLAEARFLAIDRIAALANEHAVDLVLVAGDVFDAQQVADKTIHRLFQALTAYRGPWVMIPGNHDAALAESVWTRALRLGAVPAHVHLCLKAEPLHLPALKLSVFPAPLTQRITTSDLTAGFAEQSSADGWLRVGLAHGSVQGILAPDIDSSNPIAADRASQARLDYLALGDWHGTRQVDARCWYSGTPETDRFRANESGQVLLVALAAVGSAPQVTPLACGRYRWRTQQCVLNVAGDLLELENQLARISGDEVIALRVSGHIDLAGHQQLLQVIGQTQARARAMTTDLSGLRLLPTAEDIDALGADGYLGEVIAELRAAQDGAQGELAADALGILASLLNQRPAGAR